MAEQNMNAKLYLSRTGDDAISLNRALLSLLEGFGGNLPETFALLYAPSRCFLSALRNGKFHDKQGEIEVEKEAVYEARVFNDIAELRWLNKQNGEGTAAVLCKKDSYRFFSMEPEVLVTNVDGRIKNLIGTIEQTYLLWGQSTGPSQDGWTQFAEARVGPFDVPISTVKTRGQRAQFTAVEYLGENQHGNVAVLEERLTGIKLA